MDGYITYTTGAGGTWIAWLTQTSPPPNATGRDMVALGGPVHFGIGPTQAAALAKLQADLGIQPSTRSDT